MITTLQRRAAASAVLCLLLGGCTSGATTSPTGELGARGGPTQDTLPSNPSADPAARGLAVQGTVYLLSGPDDLTMDLYRWDEGAVSPRRFTTSKHGQGVSVLTAAAGRVIATEAPSGVDHIVEIDPASGRSQELAYHFPPRSVSPLLSLDAAWLAYEEARVIDLQRHQVLFVIHALDLHTMQDHEVYTSSPADITPVGWAPDGTLCFTQEVRGGGYTVKTIGPDSAVRVLVPHTGTRSGIAWSRKGVLAVGVRPSAETDVFDQQGRQIATLSGWAPLSWSPDGAQLLLVKETPTPDPPDDLTGPGRDLAVADASNLSHPRPVGRFPTGPVWDAVWVP